LGEKDEDSDDSSLCLYPLAVYENGTTLYEMISLIGSNLSPDLSLFQPPPEYWEKK
jgi:hypothetical protein